MVKEYLSDIDKQFIFELAEKLYSNLDFTKYNNVNINILIKLCYKRAYEFLIESRNLEYFPNNYKIDYLRKIDDKLDTIQKVQVALSDNK